MCVDIELEKAAAKRIAELETTLRERAETLALVDARHRKRIAELEASLAQAIQDYKDIEKMLADKEAENQRLRKAGDE